MREWCKEDLKKIIEQAIETIPTPPPGRELALVKTKLEEALLWLMKD